MSQNLTPPSVVINSASGTVTVRQIANGAYQILVGSKVVATEASGTTMRHLMKALQAA
jgi:hypothetical protein